MKLTCPACGYYGALEGFLANEDYKKALAIICSLPIELPTLVVRYLGLFRKPGSDRALTGSRVLNICTQLEKLVKDKGIQWKGKRILENRPGYWAEAIKIILERDQNGRIERPLDGHNLLRCIAYDIAEKDFESRIREKEEMLRYRPDAQARFGDEMDFVTKTRGTDSSVKLKEAAQEAVEIAKRNLSGWRERLGVK